MRTVSAMTSAALLETAAKTSMSLAPEVSVSFRVCMSIHHLFMPSSSDFYSRVLNSSTFIPIDKSVIIITYYRIHLPL